MSHGAENFRKEILLFLKKFLVSKKIMDEKGGITFFRRKFLVSQCQKISWASPKCFRKFVSQGIRGHPFDVPETLGYRKNLCIIGGITSFRRNFFVSQCRKTSWASLQCFRKVGVSRNFMHTRGYHVFPSKIFGLTVPKNFVGIPSMSQKIWGIEKFYA